MGLWSVFLFYTTILLVSFMHGIQQQNSGTADINEEATRQHTRANKVLENLAGGIRAGLGYLGAADLPALAKNARFIRVTPAGQRESAPHDVVEIKRGDLSRS